MAAKGTMDEANRLTFRVPRRRPVLEKEHGVWVYRSGGRLRAAEAQDTLKSVRARKPPLIY